MELATGLAVRVKTNGIRAAVVPRAHRDPTPLDWERWKPTIAARYKSIPARVLIGEMNAEGLHVTEKNFRDHLQKWGMNDKNRRSAAISRRRRRALQLEGNGDKTSKPGPRYNTVTRNSSRPAMLYQWNIHNLLQTPQETLVLQRTLKGVLDWQQYAEYSTVDLDNHGTFMHLLTSMARYLFMSGKTPSMFRMITARLWTTSAELRSLMVTCTPLTVLSSVSPLSYFAVERNRSPWHHETSRFLVNAAIEALPTTHPSPLLLKLLFDNITPSQLVMMYEVGSDIIEQYAGEAASFTFRVQMLRAASYMGLSATIGSYADSLCAATSGATDFARLYDIATLYHSMGQYEKSSDVLQRCLAQCEGESDRGSTISLLALQLLSYLQSEQDDFVSEEITLQKILKTTLATDRRDLHTSQLSVDVLAAISMLDGFYEYCDLNEKRHALNLKYPSAFEL